MQDWMNDHPWLTVAICIFMLMAVSHMVEAHDKLQRDLDEARCDLYGTC